MGWNLFILDSYFLIQIYRNPMRVLVCYAKFFEPKHLG